MSYTGKSEIILRACEILTHWTCALITWVFLEALFSASCPAPALPLWRSPSLLLQTPMGFGSCLLGKDGNSEAVNVFFQNSPLFLNILVKKLVQETPLLLDKACGSYGLTFLQYPKVHAHSLYVLMHSGKLVKVER